MQNIGYLREQVSDLKGHIAAKTRLQWVIFLLQLASLGLLMWGALALNGALVAIGFAALVMGVPLIERIQLHIIPLARRKQAAITAASELEKYLR